MALAHAASVLGEARIQRPVQLGFPLSSARASPCSTGARYQAAQIAVGETPAAGRCPGAQACVTGYLCCNRLDHKKDRARIFRCGLCVFGWGTRIRT